MNQSVTVFRINGEVTMKFDGDGKQVRDKAIEKAKQGIEFQKPSTRLIADNTLLDVDVPSFDDLLVDIRHAQQCWMEERDKELFQTLKRIEDMLEILKVAY